ncbi:MAG: quinolinate synthase NadA [Spirochaetes bacterium]|nr:quinolinate synthase NadA [Spirochaetota bacterium]MCK5268957.1 quinolinate synthase NadA [Spirochaetota bacterium]
MTTNIYTAKNKQDNNMDIVKKINELKKERNAVILAHCYQPGDIQDIGDYVGDSLGLCIQAAETNADRIIFCGVRFMAESAKLLNPAKMVLLPDKYAGCPMADMINAEDLRNMKKEHPGSVVVCYVNTTAEVKAESDICCTSSNAIKVIESIPKDKKIIFVPDKHLGQYVMDKSGREMILWPGFCPTHQRITTQNIIEKKEQYPQAKVLVHPEASKPVRDMADFIGSTGQIVDYCRDSETRSFIIATENGIIHQLRKLNNGKTFKMASDISICPNMKKITLQKVLNALENDEHQIHLDNELIEKALIPIDKMMALN